MIEDALTKFQLLRDERGIFDNWLNLIQVHQILGKTAHDGRLVAARATKTPNRCLFGQSLS